MIHLDTHVAVWLYMPRLDLMSERASRLLASEELALSPMAVLELQYLHEIGRLAVDADEVVDSLRGQMGVGVAATAFDQVVRVALDQDWTRDPFDRLIASHALVAQCPLLTADERIRGHMTSAWW